MAQRFGDLKTLMETPPADILAALVELHGFGEERARAVGDFFADERHRAVLHKLMARGVSPSEPKALREGPLGGVRVCVTGTLVAPAARSRRRSRRRAEFSTRA